MQKYKILLVDDEENILKALCRLLMNKNYEIKTANSAKAGLAILEEFPAQLIISDNMMPGMTGIEFFKKVQDLYPDTIRIILTGRSDTKVSIASINKGEIFRFLIKPCNGVELNITIANGLKYYDLVKENRSLIQIVRKQHGALQEIEKKYPGITKIDREEDGTIHMEDEEYDDIIEKFRDENLGSLKY